MFDLGVTFIEKNFRQLCETNNWDEAESFLNSCKGADKTVNRICGHLHGQMLMNQGKLESAIQVFEETLLDFGSHLRLLGDLASCLYLLDLKAQWRNVFHRLETLYKEHEDSICFDTRYRVQTNLAKFYEEDGSVAESIGIYNELLELCRQDQSFAKEIRLKTQLLRLKSREGKAEGLGKLYKDLLDISADQFSKICFNECQHSLILAEYRLSGLQWSLARLNRYLQSPAILEQDRSLVYFDLMDLVLTYDGESEISKSLYQLQAIESRPKPLDKFEFSLQVIADSITSLASGANASNESSTPLPSHGDALGSITKNETPIEHLLIELLPLMTTASQLRVHSIVSRRFPHVAPLFRRQMSLLLDSLSPQSRRVWRKFDATPGDASDWRNEASKKPLSLQIVGSRLTYDSKEINLETRPALLQLIDCLAKIENGDPIEKLCLLMWERPDCTDSDYHRLRVSCNQLQKLLTEKFGLGPVVKLKRTSIEVHCEFLYCEK